MTVENTARLAVLIDGDNVASKCVAKIFDEIAKVGSASVRRIYGDWSKPHLNGWRDFLHEYSIQPVQQFANAGKNSTDIAMVIDAMDLLYTGRFSGFCIVSSDGDFTRLAIRIREQGVRVYGFVERKTPTSFVEACVQFVPLNDFNTPDENAEVTPAVPTSAEAKAATLPENGAVVAILRMAILAVADNGKANMSKIGQYLKDNAPEFRRNSGQLHKLIAASGIVDVERTGDGRIAFVRLKSTSRRAA
jgi:hypothetical protein